MFKFNMQLFSIGYMLCENCGEAFPDYENYKYCEECNACFCEKCSEKLGLTTNDDYELENCPCCLGELIDDHEFIIWLIDTFYFGDKQKAEEDFRLYKNKNK